MRYCEKCRVNIRGEHKLCPLCQGKLTGEKEEEVYPLIHTGKRPFQMFMKIATLSAAVVGIICVIINLMFPDSGKWSNYAVLALVCGWIVVNWAIRKRHHIIKNMAWQAFMLSVICLLWDYITGCNGWAVDYVIPIICSAFPIVIFILAKAGRMPEEDYVFSMFAGGVLEIIPFLFFVTKRVNVAYPTLIGIGLGLIDIVFLVLFKGKTLVNELEKRLHV